METRLEIELNGLAQKDIKNKISAVKYLFNKKPRIQIQGCFKNGKDVNAFSGEEFYSPVEADFRGGYFVWRYTDPDTHKTYISKLIPDTKTTLSGITAKMILRW